LEFKVQVFFIGSGSMAGLVQPRFKEHWIDLGFFTGLDMVSKNY